MARATFFGKRKLSIYTLVGRNQGGLVIVAADLGKGSEGVAVGGWMEGGAVRGYPLVVATGTEVAQP